MQTDLVNTTWSSADGKLFRVVDVQHNMVWYAGNDTTYSCTLSAFKSRFFIMENNYDR
jgi:hypothetical protein